MSDRSNVVNNLQWLLCFAGTFVLFLVACGGVPEGTVARRNAELHKMAMTVLSNPKVQTWKQLRAELEQMPGFPQDCLPTVTPSFEVSGERAQGIIRSAQASGGDFKYAYVFKEGKKLDDVDSRVDWDLYSQRSSLSAPAAPLSIFLDKDQNIVAYSARQPRDH